MLDPRQLLLLTEMGIPVWALRSTDEIPVDTIEQPIVDIGALLERVTESDWLICVDNKLTEHTHRLLQAMLLTVDVSHADICLLSLAELKELADTSEIETNQKVLFLLGEGAVKQAFDQSAHLANYRNEIHLMPRSQLATIVSFSLEDLIQAPENKVLAWRDCQLAKKRQQHL